MGWMRIVPVAVVAALAGTACSNDASSGPVAASRAAVPVKASPTPGLVSPPPLKEQFTKVHCDPNTTIGQAGCAEQQVLSADKQIDRRVGALWSAADKAGRRDLAKAQQAWLAYREAACASESDVYAGGSQQPVVFAQCLARITKTRASDLATQQALASP